MAAGQSWLPFVGRRKVMTDAGLTQVCRPSWRGRHLVAALWFPNEWLSSAQRQARLVGNWKTGSQAWRFDQGDLLCWPTAQSLDCGVVAGIPLCRIEGRLYAGPLTATERACIPASDLVLVDGALARPLQLRDAERLDVAAWLDVSDYAVRTLYDLALPAAALKLPDLQGKGVREVLGEVIPAASAERDSLLQQLGKGKRHRRGPLDVLRDALPRLVVSLARALPDGSAPARGAKGGSREGGVPARRPPAAPSALRRQLQRLVATSRVSKLIGYRQGAYMRRMMAMFEEGDLREALRHAIPLKGQGERGTQGQAFGTPGRRDSLAVVGSRGAGYSIDVDAELDHYLRSTYQAAFDRFDREGRIDEALFVLAELLCERQRALDYLVHHQRHAQAAELALGWEMPAASCIRLLLLAGDVERAVLVARRDGAFADAIAQLEPEHQSLADQLRVEWGHALVALGDWLGAVDAVWPVPAVRESARQWLATAGQGDDVLRARALVRRAQLLPETLDAHLEALGKLLDVEAPAAPREAMLAALQRGEGMGRARDIARQLLPVLAADRALGRVACTGKDLNRLLNMAKDAVLAADVPIWSVPAVPAALQLRHRVERLQLQAPEAGLWAVHDIVALPGRRYLVALGESGALQVNAFGQVQQRYAVPTWRLVAGDTGAVALALAWRESRWHVQRFDLVAHTVRDLGSLSMDQFATSMVGLGWTVRRGQRLMVMDTDRGLDTLLWHVELPAPVLACSLFRSREVCLIGGAGQLQEWSWDLPSRRRLPAREWSFDEELPLLATTPVGMLQPGFNRNKDALEVRYAIAGNRRVAVLDVLSEEQWETLLSTDEGPHWLALQCGLLWLRIGLPAETLGYLIRVADGGCVLRVEWPADAVLSLREQADTLVLHDDQGRVLAIDLHTSIPTTLSLR
jgi:hypothetical protein